MDKKTLKEEAVHGTVKFPLAVYRKEPGKETDGEFAVKLHWHEETEIIFLKSGRFAIDINMHRYQLSGPAMLFVGAGDIHAIWGEKGCCESAVVFDMKMLSFEHYDSVQYRIIRPLLDKTMQFPALLTEKDALWEKADGFYQKILEQSALDTPGAKLYVKAYLLQMLACLYESGKFINMDGAGEYDSRKIENIKKVLGFIQTHYDREITNKDMADTLQMNPQYFCRYFKRITGKTPTEYVNEVRIEKAAQYLQQRDRKIIDIAMECGYENMGYFIKRFKKQKGMTPSEYREKSK